MVQYAKNQPAGFVDHISKVAIIGAGGNVGKHMTQALLQTGKGTVTALTRIGSKSVLPEGVIKDPVDDANEESLVGALKGQQFLIVSMAASGGAPPLKRLSSHGGEPDGRARVCQHCGGGEAWAIVDDDEPLVLVRVLAHVRQLLRRAAAAFLSLKMLPEDEQDTDVAMERWRNRPLFGKSFVASQRDMLDSLHKVDAQRRYDEGKKLLGGPGGYLGFSHCLYTCTFFENGGGVFSDKVVKEKLGLPEEDVEEASQRAVDMALSAGEFEYAKGAH
ncbi:hypothetical protein BB8028_0007g03450 [Beauveria bassiana]|uniref:NAD(P)-binding domain-containing protein n=1 Tax=Beauveria bassiana TaxID=176275 RepID=A0A2S7YLT5_BEABA|nr:hypothetical protein BB8028_0007g03450 [Beauveria bassiana]